MRLLYPVTAGFEIRAAQHSIGNPGPALEFTPRSLFPMGSPLKVPDKLMVDRRERQYQGYDEIEFRPAHPFPQGKRQDRKASRMIR
jgi:hypothetical protein